MILQGQLQTDLPDQLRKETHREEEEDCRFLQAEILKEERTIY